MKNDNRAYSPVGSRLRMACALLCISTSASALDTATIVASVASPDCLSYRVVGMCFWLMCTLYGCSVETSVKVRHYVPDAVVSSYAVTGEKSLERRPLDESTELDR